MQTKYEQQPYRRLLIYNGKHKLVMEAMETTQSFRHKEYIYIDGVCEYADDKSGRGGRTSLTTSVIYLL